MKEDSRNIFSRKEDRVNVELYLSKLSHADLTYLKKKINRQINLKKLEERVLSEKDTTSPSMCFLKKPKGIDKSIESKLSKLDFIMSQDWSALFSGKDSKEIYYVYFHLDPRVYSRKFSSIFGCKSGVPFYVGKGSGNRAFNLKRNQGHGIAIKDLLSRGYTTEEIVHIAYSGLTESKALEIESKLIYLFGSIYQSGRKNSILLNLDIPFTPF